MNSQQKHEENISSSQTGESLNTTDKHNLSCKLDNDETTIYESEDKNGIVIVHDKTNETYFTAFGNYRLTNNNFKKIEEAIIDSKRNDINRIIQMIMILTDLNEKKNGN